MPTSATTQYGYLNENAKRKTLASRKRSLQFCWSTPLIAYISEFRQVSGSWKPCWNEKFSPNLSTDINIISSGRLTDKTLGKLQEVKY